MPNWRFLPSEIEFLVKTGEILDKPPYFDRLPEADSFIRGDERIEISDGSGRIYLRLKDLQIMGGSISIRRYEIENGKKE